MRILVALDFSECSRHALRWALARLVGFGASHVVFLYVVDPEKVGSAQLGALERAVARVRTFVEETKGDDAEWPDGVDVRFAVGRGKPAAEILEAARTHGSDTVVMGTHGREGIDRLLLGSVAETVVRRAACTVVVVKPPRAEP